MARLAFWIIILPLAVLIAAFGITNSQLVTVGLGPLTTALELPLYSAILGAVFVGILVGGISTWFGQARWRRRARNLNRRIRILSRDHEESRSKNYQTTIALGKESNTNKILS